MILSDMTSLMQMFGKTLRERDYPVRNYSYCAAGSLKDYLVSDSKARAQLERQNFLSNFVLTAR